MLAAHVPLLETAILEQIAAQVARAAVLYILHRSRCCQPETFRGALREKKLSTLCCPEAASTATHKCTTLKLRQIPAKHSGLEPVEKHEHTAAEGHLLRGVHGLPQQVRQRARQLDFLLSGLKLDHRLLLSDVRHDAQRQKLERLCQVRHADRFNVRVGLCAGKWDFTAQTVVTVEKAAQVCTLLTRNLGSCRQGAGFHSSAVTESKDGLSTLDSQPVVNDDAAPRILLCRDALHQFFDERLRTVAGSPHGHTERYVPAILQFDFLLADLHHICSRHDVDVVLLEAVHRAPLQRFIKLRQNGGLPLEKGHLHEGQHLCVLLGHVLRHEVVELGGKLAARGSTSDNNKVKKPSLLLLIDAR
mmetsp:Transcript_12489/g.38105  ORF Transcript_12489/g.38105 Transcript_12489/m.38105 type:complete len:360 (-) Transcript_12489:1016-2095(-)